MKNAFVHDVRRVKLSIPEYMNSLEDGERKGFLKAIRYFAAAEQTLEIPSPPPD